MPDADPPYDAAQELLDAPSATPQLGWWGRFGGRYVAEAFWELLSEVAQAYDRALNDEAFAQHYQRWSAGRGARPTPVTALEQLSAELGGASLWLKREDLCAHGSFCTTLAIHQALLAQRMHRTTLVTESATGDFGLALTSVGRALGMRVRVYMGREDVHHEPLRCAAIRALGGELEVVDSSARGRKSSWAEAQRFWLAHQHEALYCTSLLCSPDPYPRMIAHVLSIVGSEAKVQMMRKAARLPDFLVAPLGSGGFASGVFLPFIEQEQGHTRCVGVQAGGEARANRQSSSLLSGREGVFQGTRSMVLQDRDGQLLLPYSLAAGLSVAGVGPQHAHWAQTQQAIYVSINDEEARRAAARLRESEGILISLEAAHALAYAMLLAPRLTPEQQILVAISGTGDRDLARFDEED